MALPDSIAAPLSAEDETALREILGYLNFSGGAPDVKFQQNLNRLHEQLAVGGDTPRLSRLLQDRLARLGRESSAFQNAEQAQVLLPLVFEQVIPAYRRHHADLLFHVPADEFREPFFVARVAEATLAQGPPWNEIDRVVSGALQQLNDFLGHRPVAVLENGRQMQPYPHERFRPPPLFIKGAGVAAGRHHDLITAALEILAAMPASVLSSAYFDLAQLDELALDLRAYDHGHPVYKRTNYTFGEWDPHCLDTSGRYRRFVVRSIILDALHDWMREAAAVPADERVHEASAVLAGTMLMASSVSGSDPHTHDSNVSLTSLLPRIARQRDAFYSRLLQSLSGKHGDRLRREAQRVQQPFGSIRQHLNLYLAHYGCRQMQRAHLAWLFARMGRAAAAREQASAIPAAATRFETEIQLRLALAQLALDAAQPARAAELCVEAEAFLHRGIECGALVDPWNILGFQGQFPLFAAREDSVSDPRVDRLLALMDGFFNVQSRLVCESAALGDRGLCTGAGEQFRRLADEWDRYATTTIADLPAVHGGESYQSAERVTRALIEWHAAGKSAGDVGFWKGHLDEFQSPRSYSIVVELLLRKGDLVASMNLLLQWLSESDSVPLESGAHAFAPLLQAWVRQATSGPGKGNWPLVRRFFDSLEANAAAWGAAPRLTTTDAGELRLSAPLHGSGFEEAAPAHEAGELAADDEDEEESMYEAAYENVVFRDSAQDGFAGDTLDEPPAHLQTDLDQVVLPVEQRLRFLVALSQVWRVAAEWSLRGGDAQHRPDGQPAASAPEAVAATRHWLALNEGLLRELGGLMDDLSSWKPEEPDGDPESLGEFDRQLHVKLNLLNSAISASVALTDSSRALRCLLPDVTPAKGPSTDELARPVLQAVEAQNPAEARRALMPLLKELSRLPLLYVPLDRDGAPREILAVRNRQSLLRTLLSRLPELGLFRETWHVLRIAYVMERTSPPSGMAITEFDRLLEAAVRNTLECVALASQTWQPRPPSDEDLVALFAEMLDPYQRLWLKHSATMRLSSAETLREPGLWRRTTTFIRKYGADLFHPRMLTMGNLRGIVQRGADAYLAYLADNQDPLQPVRLLADMGGPIDREEAAGLLETVLRCIVEKFDRFLEYSTTTTQSDYGDQLHCLLDFLRLEADYERRAWDLTPHRLAHDVLSRLGRERAAELLRQDLAGSTARDARGFLQKLKRLEVRHGMRLPSITDRLSERFTKPLDLDRILSLIRPAMRDVREGGAVQRFERLRANTEEYLSSSYGSAMEPQPWLESLAEELQEVETELASPAPQAVEPTARRVAPIDQAEIRSQLQFWERAFDFRPD
ncbi:MAG: hypothetical protein ACT4QC_12395 [Planctomycetaceae bacterium]